MISDGLQKGLTGLESIPRSNLVAGIVDHQRVVTWRVPDGSFLDQITLPNKAELLAVSPGGPYLAAADSSGLVYLWSIKLPSKQTILPHRSRVHQMLFSRNGKLLATVDAEAILRIWDLGSNTELISLPQDRGVVDIQFDTEGHSLTVALDNGTAIVWRFGSDDELALMACRHLIRNLSVIELSGLNINPSVVKPCPNLLD